MTAISPISRASTPSFYDQGLPLQNKALPIIPEGDILRPPPPPLKHRPLLAGSVAPDHDRKPKRPLSWSEAQINTLQKQVKDLRQDIIAQKRQGIEKDRIIASQQQQITKYIQRESKKEDLLNIFANNVHVALEDLRGKGSWEGNTTDDVAAETIDDLITIYQGFER
ncbi:uncharacterized protein E0L32_007818 [Thyridium curvatum]|uniref:Uncharacterized protein n=1 Tax=Thyridium curvatum TaxID=1093900 RepID=A0A507B281_9PEZI|nr:uncharacterized protein E0L32_007818 [Thyridium curvatum]TPX11399.1 hypothetical protein E0L32_007818 [Thyridium curvatum]